MPRSVLRVGTRGSALALAQAEQIRKAIGSIVSHRNFELVPVTTAGDRIGGDVPVRGGKGAFTRAITEELLKGQIDLAVHSAKDLPAEQVEGVAIGGVPTREDPRDVLLSRAGDQLHKLQPGATIGTSSLRRTVQILALERGLVPTPLRGNVDTRLRRLSAGEVHAIVVALAGLRRLGKDDRVSEILPINVMLPAPGQGALAVECRASDKLLRPALAELEDPDSRAAFEAERSFSVALGGDCSLPLGALAEADGERIRLRGLIGSLDGKRILRDQIEGDDPEKVGLELAERFRALGAEEIIAEIKA
ncbi:MAG TPA: hydroxymethylbilane synthase [Actinomycetota bacterium]